MIGTISTITLSRRNFSRVKNMVISLRNATKPIRLQITCGPIIFWLTPTRKLASVPFIFIFISECPF
jgi:hypothetical protein